jgi:phage shock protein E
MSTKICAASARAAWVCALGVLAAAPAFAEDILAEISRAALTARWAQGHQGLTLVDVRSLEEFAAGHVPGAINIPLDQLSTRLTELRSQDEVVVYCLSGVRAAQAIDLLRGRDFKRVEHLTGDFADWQSSGGAVETSAP